MPKWYKDGDKIPTSDGKPKMPDNDVLTEAVTQEEMERNDRINGIK